MKYSGSNGAAAGSKVPGKKQHRIRRRLLMGGLIKRKNRSLPDLRDDAEAGAAGAEPAGAEPTGADAADAEPPAPSATAAESVAGAAPSSSFEKSRLMRLR